MPAKLTQFPARTVGPFVEGEIPQPLTVTFEDSAGDTINLTGYTGELRYTLRSDGVDSTVVRAATIPTPPDGTVVVQWDAIDMLVEGEYIGQVWVGNGVSRLASYLIRWIVLDSAVSPSAL